MRNFSGKNLHAGTGGPKGGGMDSRRTDQVAEMNPKYLADEASYAVPVGYKQTEVGVIPGDWEVKKLRAISPSQSVGLVINPSSYYSTRGNIPMLVGSHVNENKINWESANRITSESNAKLPASRLNSGDLVTVRVGDPGVTAVVPPELDQSNCASMMIIRKGDKFDSHWLCFLMNSSIGKSRVEGVQYGTAQKQFNIIDAVDFLFPFPPKPEQTAIANALSDVDALISELEKLIAKKQAIKTATMQQLLTGRTRLPQFALREDGTPTNSSGTNLHAGTGGPKGEGQDGLRKGTKPSELGEIPEDWVVVPFGNTLSIRHGKNQKAVENPNGTIPIFATGGQIGWADQYLWNKPSVLIGRKGTIDKPRYADQPFWTVDTLFYCEIKDCADPKFILYKFCMIDWMQYNEASGVPSLNASTIERVLASLPVKEEQTAIATILSDMDAEIQALEQRLGKTRQIKQGMMQELLTGRIRLVQPLKEVMHE
ncbi:restriction endonuclease subunit S [Nitrincola nitratireducens]|uniref:EcoKI restriction-modification system protein HsdS n=1 Tax=Nitrincola nitratireducens TaxID=1229521 RepID=W9V464_9GAMM|nr:restriction endonuclease subunit S [Nitrincola nitratireducens]EXJ10897.1 EcoKI restriction-modification system protein HsdS [Nitrincola nitratireducens]